MTHKITYSNENIKPLMHKIIREMSLNSFKPDLIACIVRGGVYPGICFSHYYEVPIICLTVDLNKEPEKNIALHKVADALRMQKKVLIVDEICDKGTTFLNLWTTLYNMCPELETQSNRDAEATVVERNLHFAVLIYNEGEDSFYPDYVGEVINKVEDPSWIEFEWEAWWH